MVEFGAGRFASFVPIHVPDRAEVGIQQALRLVGDSLVDRPGVPESVKAGPANQVLALAGVPTADPFDAGEHLSACLDLIEQASRALLRNVDSSGRPATTRRLHPWVVVLDRDADGSFVPAQGITLPTFFKPTPVADLARATAHLDLDLSGDTMTRYEDLWLAARRASDLDGDFTQSVLAAATASEFLVKQTAWSLEWEAAERGDAPISVSGGLFEAGPGELIGSVFAHRLRGNWSTQSCRHPAGAWRHHVARVRNAIMHRGHSASEWEALLAIISEERLCGAITAQLMKRRSLWPRTAHVLALKGGPEPDRPRYEELESFRTWLSDCGLD
ncbi:hypothetical protein [Nocardioides dokdonensis]|nr:hypothetical protein [Nocardioides dokdonensis]